MFKKIIFISFISLLLTACSTPTPPDITIPAKMPAETIPTTQPRVALVLGGGGVRSFAELGVIKVLAENNIPIDLIVGTSMGSIFGSLYADNPDISTLLPLVLNAKKSDLIHTSFFGPHGGLDNGYTMQNFILQHTKARDFSQLKIKFVAVASDLSTGQTVVLASGPIAPAVYASSALPPVFYPTHLYGYTLVDGGLSDVVPVDIAKRYYPDVIIAIDVSKQPSTTITEKSMFEIRDRYDDLHWKVFGLEQASHADIVITPNTGMTGTFDISKRGEMEKAGEAAALAALPQIKLLLKQKNILY